jgi:3-hydroxy-9,10-secoandrosta-1,3,5(10)-triene-9,17-dione monooxygenase reductase component
VALRRRGEPEPPKVTLKVEDPFATPAGDRRMDRRLRARLVGPVTVWTAGSTPRRAGLTVSSMLVAEGDPAVVLGLIDPLADLYDLVIESGRFVVHVLAAGDRRLAGMFAGTYPVDPFEEVVTIDGEFGPVISGSRHVVGCNLLGSTEVGFQALVCGRIETIELSDSSPLVRYRGQYRKLSQER